MKTKYKIALFCVVAGCLGYVIGYTLGYASGVGMAFDLGVKFLETKDIGLDVNKGLMITALTQYSAQLNRITNITNG